MINHIDRLQAMLGDCGQTWDLSGNDKAAIAALLQENGTLKQRVAELDWLANQSGAALINDDQGSWAVAFDGQQSLSSEPPDDCQTMFFIEKRRWKLTISEAIQYAMREENEAQLAGGE
jgi:hypothetical protein